MRTRNYHPFLAFRFAARRGVRLFVPEPAAEVRRIP